MSAEPLTPEDEWEPLTRFDEIEPPELPLDLLPAVLRDMSRTVARSAQIDPAVPALLGLGAVATLAQKTVRVAATSQWAEQLSLFVIAVAPSGERKSSAYSHMVGPVHDLEAELAERDREDRIRRNEQRLALEAQIRDVRKLVSKGKGDLDEVAQLAAELEAMGPEELAPRLATDDATTQALKTLMAANRGRVGLLSPEAGFLHVLKGAYSSNGEPADMSALLSAYTGSEPIIVDRTGRTGERISRPALTLVMVGQPQVLNELLRIPGAQERGLVGRFVVAQVAPLAGTAARFLRTDVAAEPGDSDEGKAYAGMLGQLSQREVLEEPPVLRLTDEALEHYRQWHDALEVERGPEGGEWSVIPEFANKAHGLALRFAGLCLLCEDPLAGPGDEIDLETMRRACELADWALAAHKAAVIGARLPVEFRRAHRIVGASQRGTLARSRPQRGRWAPFTERDVRLSLGGGNKRLDNAEVLEAIEVLAAHGYIRRSQRVADAWEWHPDLVSGGQA